MAALKKMTVPMSGAARRRRAADFGQGIGAGSTSCSSCREHCAGGCRLIAAANLKVQEAALTGESESVDKDTADLPDGDLALADRRNMIYRGTVVTYGRGEAVVTGTGMQTELGKIATMLQDVEDEQTPLQRRLGKLGRSLAMAAGYG